MTPVGDPRRWLLVGVLPVACVFDSAGAGASGDVADTDTDGSESSSSATTDATPGTTTASSQSGTGGPTTEAPDPDSSTGPSGETTGGDPSDPVLPRADLVFIAPAPLDLGLHPLAGQDVMTLELANEGDAAANILGGEDPPAPLIWAGGAFPGTDGTCQGLIPPGGECVVTLAVGPGYPGIATGPVEVRFDDMVGVGSALTQVEVTSTGEGPNMIVNPDAEADGPGEIMTGWDPSGSTFRADGEHNHESGGSLSFFAGGSEQPAMTQEVMLTDWAESIDTLEMEFRFRGWSRSRDDTIDDDPHDIDLLFLDGSGTVLGTRSRDNMTHDGWEQTSFDAVMPVGTRRVRIRLSCDRNDFILFNDNCSAWFDDMAGRLAYPG